MIGRSVDEDEIGARLMGGRGDGGGEYSVNAPGGMRHTVHGRVSMRYGSGVVARHGEFATCRDTAEPAIAANRFGLGARPGELAQIGSDPAGLARSSARRRTAEADGRGACKSSQDDPGRGDRACGRSGASQKKDARAGAGCGDRRSRTCMKLGAALPADLRRRSHCAAALRRRPQSGPSSNG